VCPAGLLDFGRRELEVPYTIKQFPFYIMLGILGTHVKHAAAHCHTTDSADQGEHQRRRNAGGLLGAIFNFCNKWIHTTRVKLKHPVVQGLEVLALGLTTSVLFYIVPYYYPSCKCVCLPRVHSPPGW
jgi:hypothetical protein